MGARDAQLGVVAMARHRAFRWAVVALPLAVTALLWALAKLEPPQTGLAPLRPLLALSQISALAAVVLMALALMLSARSRVLETIYGGLDKALRVHRRLGECALLLMLVHLLTLLPGAAQLAPLLLPFVEHWPKTLGVLSLWAFMLLSALAFWRRLPYQAWLLLHRWMGLPFLLGGAHAMGAASDVAGNEPLRFWMLLWVALGALAWCYRMLFFPALGPRYDYRVERVVARGAGAWDLLLQPTAMRMNFEPGRFAFIAIRGVPGLPAEHHPFSISSSPAERQLRFSFKAVGDYTRALPLLQRGTPVQVYGPFGHFTLHRLCRWRRMVWIGAGIGITPFLSMLAFEATNDDFRRIWLFHVVRHAQDAVYDGEIAQRIALADSWVDYVKWVSDERGPLTAHAVLASLGAFDDCAFMICGPTALARELKRQLEQRGVGSHRIMFEDFAFR